MPMSYVFNKAQETFYLIVHVPLTRQEEVMDMFQYVQFPMTMSTSEDHASINVFAGILSPWWFAQLKVLSLPFLSPKNSLWYRGDLFLFVCLSIRPCVCPIEKVP